MKKAAQRVAADVASVATLSLAELRAEWQRRYGPPPRHRAADLLRRVLAWRIQADVLGGLDAPTRRMEEMVEATGWQSHTVRAAMTGLRKRGYEVERHTEGTTTVWSVKAAAK